MYGESIISVFYIACGEIIQLLYGVGFDIDFA